MSTYGQFCPVAMASEVLTERWTPLLIRELLCGSTRLNDLRRGVPLMSPSLLSKRLKTLERVGVIERRPATAGRPSSTCSRRPARNSPDHRVDGGVGTAVGAGDVAARQMDASLLMWDIHRNIVVDDLPPERVVVFFHLRGSIDKKSRFWLVLQNGAADVCLSDPGYDVDLAVTGHVRTMVDYWMGHIEFADVVRSGDLEVNGPRRLARALPTWFGRSLFAPVELPDPVGV